MPILVKTSEAKFRQAIIRRFRENALKQSAALRRVIKEYLQGRIEYYFLQSPTVRSILEGVLRRDLGLTNPGGKLFDITNTIVDSIKVSTKSVPGSNVLFAVGVQVLEEFDQLYLQDSAEQAATKADGSPGQVDSIPWLYWLLEAGSQVVVANYQVREVKVGRSGVLGIMGKSRNPGFFIERQFQGVENDNFITRILDNVAEDMDNNLWQIVRPVLTRVS